ncbi:MAG: hypothetical protein K0R71_2160 [Bacillales bacterium]|jgi:hypothetical protein|nr:hypothetical protein [Bacillales bacterium]
MGVGPDFCLIMIGCYLYVEVNADSNVNILTCTYNTVIKIIVYEVNSLHGFGECNDYY